MKTVNRAESEPRTCRWLSRDLKKAGFKRSFKSWHDPAIPIYVLTLTCLWLPASAVDFLWSSVMLVPRGWVSHYFAASSSVGPKIEAYLVVPAVAICLSLPFAFRIAQKRLCAELDLQTTDGNLEQVFRHSEETDESTAEPAEPIFAETPIQIGSRAGG